VDTLTLKSSPFVSKDFFYSAMNGQLLIAFGIWCLCRGQVVVQKMQKMKPLV